MSIYLLIAFVLSIFAITKNKILLIFSFLILLLVGGLRSVNIGTDTISYQELFNWSRNGSEWVKSFEYGYYFLNRFVHLMGGEFQLVIFLSMMLVLTPIFIVSYIDSKNPNYSILLFVLLYFWLYSFNLSRQYIATSILLIAYYYLKKARVYSFVIWVLIASLFHTSALFSFFVLFFYKYRVSIYIWILSILFSLFISMIPGLFTSILLNMGITSITHYNILTYSKLAVDTSFPLSRILLSIMGILMLIFQKEETLYMKIFLWGVVILNLFSFHAFASRVAWIYLVVQILLIPNFDFKKEYIGVSPYLRVYLFVYSIIVFIHLLFGNVGDICPYEFFM